MIGLSLTPRGDLVKFKFPKDFLPEEIEKKYTARLSKNQSVITTAIDYLNESIQSISFPGISDINIQQTQHSRNSFGDGKLNVEPKTDITYQSPANPLDKIEKEFKVNLRTNQGYFNYFMMYETVFYQICKPLNKGHNDIFVIEILGEDGTVTAQLKLYDVLIDGIDGLEFDYTKNERSAESFSLTFKFNNIDFDFV